MPERIALETLYDEIEQGMGSDCKRTVALSFLDQAACGLRGGNEKDALEGIYAALWDCDHCTRYAINRYETIIEYSLKSMQRM